MEKCGTYNFKMGQNEDFLLAYYPGGGTGLLQSSFLIVANALKCYGIALNV